MKTKLSKPPIILLLGRDDWQKDLNLNYLLVNHIQKMGIRIAWEDPMGNAIWLVRFRLGRFLKKFERLDKFVIRVIQAFYAFFHWRYIRHLIRQYQDNQKATVVGRCSRVKERINQLSKSFEVIIISRSSGGRIASLIADETNVNRMVCLGYPFQNPENGVEPERYLHLPFVETRFLIIQGMNDVYGGSEIIDKYKFHPNTEICLFDTDHGFNMSPNQWISLFTKMDDFIRNSGQLELRIDLKKAI